VLNQCGFTEISWVDKTDASVAWFAELQSRFRSSPPLGLPVVMGPQFLEMAENPAKNLQDGRVCLVQTIVMRT
jgi:hypothetical protein